MKNYNEGGTNMKRKLLVATFILGLSLLTNFTLSGNLADELDPGPYGETLPIEILWASNCYHLSTIIENRVWG